MNASKASIAIKNCGSSGQPTTLHTTMKTDSHFSDLRPRAEFLGWPMIKLDVLCKHFPWYGKVHDGYWLCRWREENASKADVEHRENRWWRGMRMRRMGRATIMVFQWGIWMIFEVIGRGPRREYNRDDFKREFWRKSASRSQGYIWDLEYILVASVE